MQATRVAKMVFFIDFPFRKEQAQEAPGCTYMMYRCLENLQHYVGPGFADGKLPVAEVVGYLQVGIDIGNLGIHGYARIL